MTRLERESKRALGVDARREVVVPRSKRHQRGGTECGYYCVYFVERLLAGADIREFDGSNGRVTNTAMRRYAKTLFPGIKPTPVSTKRGAKTKPRRPTSRRRRGTSRRSRAPRAQT